MEKREEWEKKKKDKDTRQRGDKKWRKEIRREKKEGKRGEYREGVIKIKGIDEEEGGEKSEGREQVVETIACREVGQIIDITRVVIRLC